MNWPTLPRRREKFAALLLLAMAIGHGAMVFNVAPSLKNGYQDFTIFYTAATMLRSGQASSLYDADVQYQTEKEFAPDVRIRHAALPYVHTPFEALLFVPFTFLGYVPAYALWTVLNVALIVLNLWLLRRNFPPIGALSPVLIGLSAAGFFPIAIGLIQGQDTILVLLSVVLCLVLLKEKRDARAGLALGLGLFKFHFVGPLALILAFRRPRLLLGFVPIALCLCALSISMVGVQGVVHYVDYVLNLERTGAGGAIMASDMPNLRGLIDTAFGLRTDTTASMAITLVSSIAVLWVTQWRVRRGQESVLHTFALATIAAILVSYHALPYDLVLLFPSVLMLLANAVSDKTQSSAVDTGLLILFFLTPLYVLLWLQLNQFAWFGVLLICLMIRLDRAGTSESIPQEAT
jgi:hypothetical protein